MAVEFYLKAWDYGQLSHVFENFTLEEFLSMPYSQAMCYGVRFAEQHQKLCDTLKTVLMHKCLMDETEHTLTTPQSVPHAPRKKKRWRSRRTKRGSRTEMISPVDNLTSQIDNLSVRDRLGSRRKLFKSPADKELSVTVRDRLGFDRTGVSVQRAKTLRL